MSNNSTKFSINEENAGSRLDVILTKLIPDLTRSNLKKIINMHVLFKKIFNQKLINLIFQYHFGQVQKYV